MKVKEVAVIIVYDYKGKILIQHRSSDAPTSPKFWGLFGGKIEKGESPIQAVKRETFEELNVSLKNPKLVLKKNVVRNGKEKLVHVYIQRIKDKSKIKLKEGQGMKWIFPKEINKLHSRTYVKKIIKEIEGRLQNDLYKQ